MRSTSLLAVLLVAACFGGCSNATVVRQPDQAEDYIVLGFAKKDYFEVRAFPQDSLNVLLQLGARISLALTGVAVGDSLQLVKPLQVVDITTLEHVPLSRMARWLSSDMVPLVFINHSGAHILVAGLNTLTVFQRAQKLEQTQAYFFCNRTQYLGVPFRLVQVGR